MPKTRTEIVNSFLNIHGKFKTDLSGMSTHVIVRTDEDDLNQSAYPLIVVSDDSDEKGINYDVDKYFLGIGSTGWSWNDQVTKWVAYDFDSIVGHIKAGLTDESLKEILKKLEDIPWVSIYRSKSGKGFHVYVHFDKDIKTESSTEHSAVARAVLAKMSAMTGYNFESRVDIVGGIMWVWHRDQGDDAFVCLKSGINYDSSVNWKEFMQDSSKPKYHSLSTSKVDVTPDTTLPKYLEETNAKWWWDDERNLMVAHTLDLAQAHKALGMQGKFETNSSHSTEHNCFLFPVASGGWIVRRFGKGVNENKLWASDDNGWTYCYLDRPMDLDTICRYYNGIEIPAGGYSFSRLMDAVVVLEELAIPHGIPTIAGEYTTTIAEHKDGRLLVCVEDKENRLREELSAWLYKTNKRQKLFKKNRQMSANSDISTDDDSIRHLVTVTGEEIGWAIKTADRWCFEPLGNARLALTAKAYKAQEISVMLGNCILKNWTVVKIPFAPDYPGGRKWNLNAAKLQYDPKECHNYEKQCPHWAMIINHAITNLDVSHNKWCKDNGISSSMYLLFWIASMFQMPNEPLPYLFLYGEQNTGKTTLHEAISLLFNSGYIEADTALTSQNDFNGELESQVLCVVEEIHLGDNVKALNRMKKWVTNTNLQIHKKGLTPYLVTNTTHWIQTSNDYGAAPVFPGDTRITMVNVPKLEKLMRKGELYDALKREASHFLGYLLKLKIPTSPDRLRIPVIETSDKLNLEARNCNPVMSFIKNECNLVDGEWILFSDFFNKFRESLDNPDKLWTKQAVIKGLPFGVIKGRSTKDNQVMLANISFDKIIKSTGLYKLVDNKLIREVDDER